VLLLPPSEMFAVGGEMATLVNVGLTKNPLQLTPVASATNTVKARVNASLRPVNISECLE
jgi:hypothetical protein